MRVCLYYSVWLTVVLFGLSLSAVGIGRAAPLPYEVAALGMSDVESCDGVCFAGVTAGKTNWLEARKNLASQVRMIRTRKRWSSRWICCLIIWMKPSCISSARWIKSQLGG